MKKQSAACWGVLLPILAGALLGCGGDKSSGPPGAPERVVAQAADAQALVKWEPPKWDGGDSLLYYIVRCEPACGGALVRANERQATVLGLNNGTPYVFKVAALNRNGEGPFSPASESVLPRAGAEIPDPTAPGQPRAVRATPGNGQVYVSWLAPASFGGRPLQSYRVTAQPTGVSVTVPAPAASVLIPGLENGHPYSFTVVATNEVGDGPAAVAAPVRPFSGGAPASWVNGYWVGYARHLQNEEAVDFTGLTHVVVGRFKPRHDGTVNADLDFSAVLGPTIAKTLSRRAHQAGRKALMMLGGDGEHDNFVKATSDASRPVFVHSLITLMDELGYDGIDLDWEPILLPEDGVALLTLVEELRAARPDIILTVPVFPKNTNFGMARQEAEFMAQLAARVDQLNIMSYNMSGAYPGWEAWHSSPLEDHAPSRPMSVASSVQMYLEAGVPAGRLGVGIGFFGMCWQGVTEPRIPLEGRMSVRPGQSDNAMSYANIMAHYYEAEARRWDAQASVPYLSLPSVRGPEHCNFISYEDSQSIIAKGQYVRRKGLGGAIIWNINQGHIATAPEGERDPLSAALKSAFLDP